MRGVLTAAIARGAPTYNSGNVAGCYEIYRATAQQLLESGAAQGVVRETLREAMMTAGRSADADKAAWAMRRAFDSILAMKPSTQSSVTAPSSKASSKAWTIVDFMHGLSPAHRWEPMNDSVMGGVSTSALSHSETKQAALFKGRVQTANNGGFASVRSANMAWGADGARGLRIWVNGDNRQYKMCVKTDDKINSVTYQHDFFVPASSINTDWTQIDLPFDEFTATWRAQIVADAPRLIGSNIRQLGFMLSKFADTGGVVGGFQPGEFSLYVSKVLAYK